MPSRTISLFLLISLFSAACQPAPLPGASTATATQGAVLTPTRPAGPPTSSPSPTRTAAPTLTPPPTLAPPTLAPLLRLGIPEDISTTNVWALFDTTGASYANYAVQGGYWPALFTSSQPGYSFIPELADDFPVPLKQEGELWVGEVVLKRGLVWSDGSPLTAFDVAFTANTVLLFNLEYTWRTAYNPAYLDRVEAVDERTVKFYFTNQPPITVWQYGALQGPVVSQAYWAEKIAPAAELMQSVRFLSRLSEPYLGQRQEALRQLFSLDSADEPAGGPFRFDRREAGRSIENVMNPAYLYKGWQVQVFANGAVRMGPGDVFTFSAYGDPEGEPVWAYRRGPYYERVRYIVVPPESAGQALVSGQIDFYLSPWTDASDPARQVRGESNIGSHIENGFRYLAFNHGRAHLVDSALRRAAACLVDADDLAEWVLAGNAEPVFSPVLPENLFWHNPAALPVCHGLEARQRLETAVSLLKEAGYTWEAEPVWDTGQPDLVVPGSGLQSPNGKPFPTLTLLAPPAGVDRLLAASAVAIAKQLRQLGLEIELEEKAWDDIALAVYQTGQYDLALLHTRLNVFPDHLCAFFVTGSNPYQFSSLRIDQQCDIFTTTSDLAQARQAAFALQEILVSDMPFVYLFTTPVNEAWLSIQFPAGRVLDGFAAGLLGVPDLIHPADR